MANQHNQQAQSGSSQEKHNTMQLQQELASANALNAQLKEQLNRLKEELAVSKTVELKASEKIDTKLPSAITALEAFEITFKEKLFAALNGKITINQAIADMYTYVRELPKEDQLTLYTDNIAKRAAERIGQYGMAMATEMPSIMAVALQ